jgi:aspartate kinase
MEQAIISGITHEASEAKVTITRVDDRPGVAARLFRSLADSEINVDMIVQNVSTEGHTDISFTVPESDLGRTIEVAEKIAGEVGASGVSQDSDIARVSVIGAGMRSNPGIAAQMFEVLSDEGVNILMISTSSIRISCVVRAGDVEKAVRSLHTAFGLDAE